MVGEKEGQYRAEEGEQNDRPHILEENTVAGQRLHLQGSALLGRDWDIHSLA